MRQLRVELTRLRSRRAVVLLLLAATLVTALLAAGVIWDNRPVTDTQLASAQAQATAAASEQDVRRDLNTCHHDPQAFFGPGGRAEACDQQLMPRTEDYLDRVPLHVGDVRNGRGLALMLLLAAFALIAGTTFAGADWANGSMSTQLLFVPQRTKVWLAKAAAITLGTALVAAVLLGAFWTTISLVSFDRGAPIGQAVAVEVRWQVLRAVVLAAGAGLGGYALTMALRHTVAAVGVLFAYAVGGEALVSVIPLHRVGAWSLGNNVMAWLRNGTRVFDDRLACAPSLSVCDRHYVVSVGHGAAYLTVLLAVTLLVSWLTFRHRDTPRPWA